ncbi:MAG: hypothetical protein ACPGXW_04635 [Synechococcus sp.]
MSVRPPLMVLTWSGFDVAVDLIAAQCVRRDRSGVYGVSGAGQVVIMPWQDIPSTCREPFLIGFHD